MTVTPPFVTAICEEDGVTLAQLRGRSQVSEIIMTRWKVVSAALRRGWSQSAAGRLVGRGPSVVNYYVKGKRI